MREERLKDLKDFLEVIKDIVYDWLVAGIFFIFNYILCLRNKSLFFCLCIFVYCYMYLNIQFYICKYVLCRYNVYCILLRFI